MFNKRKQEVEDSSALLVTRPKYTILLSRYTTGSRFTERLSTFDKEEHLACVEHIRCHLGNDAILQCGNKIVNLRFFDACSIDIRMCEIECEDDG